VVAGVEGSPLQPIMPFGAEPLLPFRAAARAAGLDSTQPLFQASIAIVAVVAITAAFLYALRESWRGTVSVRLVAWLGVAFVALAVALPLLFSRDVYSYSMYGRIQSVHHANPYVATPQDFSRDPFFPLVGPEWRTTTAVYGPAFSLLSAGLTSWLKTPVALIWAYKVIAGGTAILTILLVARLSRRLWPSRAAFATALVAWNPVFLFHGVAAGHNDLLVGLAVIAALTLLARRSGTGRGIGTDGAVTRPLWPELGATAALTLGALVKATAAIPLILVVVVSVWRRPADARSKALVAHIGVVVALSVAFMAPLFQTKDPTFGLATLATHEGWLAPSRFFRVVLGHVGHVVGGEVGKHVMQGIVRIAFPVVFAVALVAIVRFAARAAASLDARAQGATWGWALLVATLAAPVLLPWYIVWTLPVVWLLPRTARRAAVLVSAVLTVSQTVAAAVHFPSIFHGTLLVGHYVLTPVLFVVFVVLLRDLRSRLETGAGLVSRPPPPSQEHREIAAAGHHR
jgi:hypothetical protein